MLGAATPVAAADSDTEASAPTEAPVVAVEPATGGPTEAVPPEPVPGEPVPGEPVPGEPVPAEPEPEPPPVDPPAPTEPPPPAEPPAAEPEPPPLPEAQPPASTAPEPTAPPDPVEAVEPEADEPTALAHNQSRVVQAIVQVQRGCQSYCYGTTLTQEAAQRSETEQTAHAHGVGAGSGAAAINDSSTVQFVWQVQLGCVAFCFDTSQTQTAAQSAQTTQSATALSEALAVALNAAESLQLVFQYQQGCEEECHDASSSQSVVQNQGTRQSATAEGGDGVLGWLVALAENLGVTLQTIFQFQDSECLEFCFGGTQSQQALQEAVSAQQAVAGRPPSDGSTPVAGTAPAKPAAAAAGGVEPALSATAPQPSSAATSPARLRAESRRHTAKRHHLVTVNAGSTQTRPPAGASGGRGLSPHMTTIDDPTLGAEHTPAAGATKPRSAPTASPSTPLTGGARALAAEAELRSQSEILPLIAGGVAALLAGLALAVWRRPRPHPGV